MKKLFFLFILAFGVHQLNAFTVTINHTNVTCFGACNGTATAVPSGGTAPYTYSWASPAASTQTISGLCAGVYTVTVVDATTAFVSQTCTIIQPSAITTSPIVINPTCNGNCNGSINVNPSGGTPPYTYVWAPNGITTQFVGGLCAGVYTCTITDAQGCTATPTFMLTQPMALTLSLTTTAITCNGGTGSITAVVSGGSGPYSYSWSPVFGNSATLSNVPVGTYTCTVTDMNGCTQVSSIALNQPSAISLSASVTNASCFNACDGSATITASGGTPAYTYAWSPAGGNFPTLNSACPGNYTCTVTDSNGCTDWIQAVINQPGILSASVTPANSTVCLNAPITVDPGATGGTAPYTYSWSSGGGSPATSTIMNPQFSYNTSGTYTITVNVSDAHGCSTTATTTVTVSPAPNITISPNYPTICSGSNVTLSGGGAMTYYWTPSFQTTASVTFTPTVTTSYTLTGTDAMGCIGTAYTTVTVDIPPAVIPSTIEAGCNHSDGSANINVTGNAPFVYYWSPILITSQNAINIPAGTYTVDVTDNAGCVTTNAITVGDSCDFVWPGDANDDAISDNNDILDIGIANGATGTTRANATLNWIGQPSTPWGQTLLSGTDYKWVDCNGDGVIDPSDTTAVIQNFGMTHNNRFGAPVYDASLPDLTITMGQNTLASMAPGTLSVALGTSSVPVSNLYGIAFTLNFDPAQIDASSFRMNENGTWMGTPGTDMMGVVMNSGSGVGAVEIALTRLDHQNVNGFGNLANVGFVATANLNGTGNTQNVNFSISNVTVISANQTTQTVNTVNDSVLVVDPGTLGISVNTNSQNINAYPNPFNESVQIVLPESAKGKNCVVTLTDASGRVVLTQQSANANSMIIHRGQLEAGIYFCTVRSEGQMIGNTKLIVK